MTIHYEWDIETQRVDGGEVLIIDHDHRDKLSEFGMEEVIQAINRDVINGDGDYTTLVLVRDRYDHRDLACRSWAYVTDDGKMPDQFLDAYDKPVAKVPKRFIEEFNR